MFKSGPLAWNGLISFWIPAAVYTVWMCLLTWLLLRAITAQEPRSPVEPVEEPASPAGVSA